MKQDFYYFYSLIRQGMAYGRGIDYDFCLISPAYMAAAKCIVKR